jgi:putative transposon-encoded protein
MRRMKTKQIESTVTKSGNSGHIIVPNYWIGQDVIVKLKEVKKQIIDDQNKSPASGFGVKQGTTLKWDHSF